MIHAQLDTLEGPRLWAVFDRDFTGSSAGKMCRIGVVTDLCAQKQGPQKKIKAPIIIGSPIERIALDVLGPLPLTESGNKYIVVIADYFTKSEEALPIPYPTRKPPQLPSYSLRKSFADSECPTKYIPTRGETLN